MTTCAEYAEHLQKVPKGIFPEGSFRSDAATIANPQSRMDANTLPFLAQQLEQIQAKVYETPHAALPFMEGAVIPIVSTVDPGAETFSYYTYDGKGQAEFITNYASDDMPVVDIEAKKTTKDTAGIQLGYTLNRQELRAASFGNVDVARRKANQATLGHREKHELVAAYGSKARGLDGFLNHQDVPELAPVADGASLTRWDLKDPIFIAIDLANIAVAIHNATKGIRKTTALLLPADLFEFLRMKPFLGAAGTVVTATPSMSVLDYMRSVTDMTIGSLLMLQPQFSSGNLAPGQGTVVAYIANNADMVSYQRIMDATFYEPQWKGLSSTTPGESRTGGVQLIEPFAMIRMPGVSL